MSRPQVQLGGGRWVLWRLADDEFKSLGQHALAISQSYEHLLELDQPSPKGAPRLSLAQAACALERSFGPSSPLFDSFRSSFSFPLLLTLERQRRISYLLRCHDHRAMLYFPLYRIVTGDPSAEERSRYHPPLADEFSQADMNEFVSALYDHLLEVAQSLAHGLVARFYRAIPSDLILYGYDGTSFFENAYESLSAYELARQDLDASLGWSRPRSSSDRVERIIDRVTEWPSRPALEDRGPQWHSAE